MEGVKRLCQATSPSLKIDQDGATNARGQRAFHCSISTSRRSWEAFTSDAISISVQAVRVPSGPPEAS